MDIGVYMSVGHKDSGDDRRRGAVKQEGSVQFRI
jgi:hypothetical protein